MTYEIERSFRTFRTSEDKLRYLHVIECRLVLPSLDKPGHYNLTPLATTLHSCSSSPVWIAVIVFSMPFAIDPMPPGPVGMLISRPLYPILESYQRMDDKTSSRVAHLSTTEITAAVPVPKTSTSVSFFSASTNSAIVVFRSETTSFSGKPAICRLPLT